MNRLKQASFIMFLILMCTLYACKNRSSIEYVVFSRPSEDKYFLNLTKNNEADLVAINDLNRARSMNGIEYCMIIIERLPEGESMQTLAVDLFEQWRVGEKHKGKGVLYLINDATRELKIEVSYELEPIFPDSYCASFQETIDHYYAGDFFGDVVSNLIITMARRYNEDSETDIAAGSQVHGTISKNFLSGGAGIHNQFLKTQEDILNKVEAINPEILKKYQPSEDPLESANLYIDSLVSGISYPNLPLLTRGSHLMYHEYPKSKGYQMRDGRQYQNAGSPTLFVQKDLAVVRFSGDKALPILLRRNDQIVWLVDRVSTWSQSHFDIQKGYAYPARRDHQWMFAFRDYSYRLRRHRAPLQLPLDIDPLAEVGRLTKAIEKNPSDPKLYFRLAEVLYFECYWIGAAMEACEQGLNLNPKYTQGRWLFLKMGYRYPKLNRHEHHYQEILKYSPKNRRAWNDYIWFCRTFLKDEKKARSLEKRKKQSLK